MKDNIEAAYFDDCSAHCEQVVHNLMADGVMPGSYTWPKPDATLGNWQKQQIIVAKVDGVPAGRACLSNGYYPFAELENLFVDPAYRGQGVGSKLVDFAVRQAAQAGYLAVHLQTEFDNRRAQRLYRRKQFIPATQGKYLRMVRFLSYPALSQFNLDHPLALLQSERRDTGWGLRWHDPVGRDAISILLSGGSAQADSNGYGPGVAGVEISNQGSEYCAEIEGPREAVMDSDFEVRLRLRNRGNEAISGACRLLLNQGFEAAEASRQSQAISVEPGCEQEIALIVRATELFDQQIMKVLTYRSAAVCAEFLIGRSVFWLSHEVIVAG